MRMGYWKWIYKGTKEIFKLKETVFIIGAFSWFVFMSFLGVHFRILFNFWLLLLWCIITIGIFFLVFLYMAYLDIKAENLEDR